MGKILTTVDEIQGRLGMTQEEAAKLSAIVETYPMAVPEYYLSLIDENDPNDPIRRMCIPSEDEMDGDGVYDTSGESDNTVAVGLQHKYPQTVLILSTNHCAMYCRHCFRKRMVGATEAEINKNFLQTVDYISAHPEVNNVLITGGDALMLSHERLGRYLAALTMMEQLDFIRIGSRLPVVFPEKLTSDEKLQEILASAAKKKQLYLITQFNHPREVTPEAAECVRKFREMGIVVRNQTVLLKGVNDDPQVLGTLLRKLTAIGVLCVPVSTGARREKPFPGAACRRRADRGRSEAYAEWSGQGFSLLYVDAEGKAGDPRAVGRWSDALQIPSGERRGKSWAHFCTHAGSRRMLDRTINKKTGESPRRFVRFIINRK